MIESRINTEGDDVEVEFAQDTTGIVRFDIEPGQKISEKRYIDITGIEDEAHVKIEDTNILSPRFSAEDQCSEEITKITENIKCGKGTFMKISDELIELFSGGSFCRRHDE